MIALGELTPNSHKIGGLSSKRGQLETRGRDLNTADTVS